MANITFAAYAGTLAFAWLVVHWLCVVLWWCVHDSQASQREWSVAGAIAHTHTGALWALLHLLLHLPLRRQTKAAVVPAPLVAALAANAGTHTHKFTVLSIELETGRVAEFGHCDRASKVGK